MAFDKSSHERLMENLSRCERKAVSKEKEKPWEELMAVCEKFLSLRT